MPTVEKGVRANETSHQRFTAWHHAGAPMQKAGGLTMHATCPDCGCRAPLPAFFIEDDGKRLALLVADMPPLLGRAALSYLSLFKPAKQGLRLSRAVQLMQALSDLIKQGSVCKDERSGVRRAASVNHWASGIETMLDQRANLSLPLDNHHYLRSVVFALADKADAQQEQQRERQLREGAGFVRHAAGKPRSITEIMDTPLNNQLLYIDNMQRLGGMSAELAELERRQAREKYG